MQNIKKIKRVALINPFQVTLAGYNIDTLRLKGQFAELPLGLAYISAYIKKHGYDVKIFDAHIMAIKGLGSGQYSNLKEVENGLINNVMKYQPDIVGISCLFHFISRMSHKLAGLIKNKNKDIINVMGGVYATVSTEAVLSDKNIDFVVLGEGEKPFLNLLEALNRKLPLDGLASVARRNGDKPVINRVTDHFDSLDEIPLPDRDDFVLEDYYRYGRHFIQRYEEFEGKELKIATVIATRGCVFDCSFCLSKEIWGRKLRVRNPENVLDEIEFLVKEHGINYISFNDESLITNKKFARHLFKGIIKRKLNIGWTTGGVTIRCLDEEMVELMVKSGCIIFNVAVESGCEEVLKDIKKSLNLKEVVRAVELIKKYNNTYIMGLFMLGFPEETEKQFFQTIDFGKSLKLDWTVYSSVTPFPGSDIYNEAKSKMMVPDNIENNFEALHYKNYIMKPRHLTSEFVNKQNYFAYLDQNFLQNPNLTNGRMERALSDFKFVIKQSPTHASAYYCMGTIYEEQGKMELAIQNYKKANDYLSGLDKEYFELINIDLPSIIESRASGNCYVST